MSYFVFFSCDLLSDVVPFDVSDFTWRNKTPLSYCVGILNHLGKKCPYIDVGFCVSLILEEVKGFFSILECTVGFFFLFLPFRMVVAYPYMCSALFMTSTVMLKFSRRLLLT